ncbi:EcsC family protein [Nocardioides sp. BP30]|uniref:EcsC family protein n=1 Tax=Nocardioides sp. BP30 TaxID=3036374 RepID=UPI002469253D|nr:EcsC family protein [Nocardioides sp. BP30]WGL52666.1 EcsC family protein [Nocardioides sp. BP30]
MVQSKKVAASLGTALAPKVIGWAPGVTSSFVLHALNRAIVGVGPLPGAAEAADKQLEEQHGDSAKAVHEVIENHVTYAGAGGFVTNIGGLVTAAFTIPTNITGLALIQCRMVAGIAHLRGYDLEDARTRHAILACILGRDRVDALVKAKRLPAPPMALATAPVTDPELDRLIPPLVASEMVARMAGKRLAVTVGRKIPVVGGVVGAGADGYVTWRVGRYASRELLPRAR